jgi:predicted ATP-grasp superfamily ATP-dependent carboligase
MSIQQLLIVGASARAACFSARRSSYSPYWLDQYGDYDLVENFPGKRLASGHYPDELVDLIRSAPNIPFLYTGALENHLEVLAELEEIRPLLGNSAEICLALREPVKMSRCFDNAGIKHPRILPLNTKAELNQNEWLLKSIRSAGGSGVSSYRELPDTFTDTDYLQEFIDGENSSGLFISNGKSLVLLGVTRQLVGEKFLNAAEFSYCGSIGCLKLERNEREQWQHIGESLVNEFGLCGLFGVDAICSAGDIYPIEVNPRYTASVEVIESSLNMGFIGMHWDACHGKLPETKIPMTSEIWGKAYLFAPGNLMSPDKTDELYIVNPEISMTADIPVPGTHILGKHPVMTVFAQGKNYHEVMQKLRDRTALLYSKFSVV